MTPSQRRTQIKTAVKEGMNEKVRTVYVDLEKAHDAVIHVSICYGQYGIDNVKLTIMRMGGEKSYHIHSIEGNISVYMIRDLDKAFAEMI